MDSRRDPGEPCVLATYETAFDRARAALDVGQDLHTVFEPELTRDRATSEAMAILLAMTDAKRGHPKREKWKVCEALFTFCRCDRPAVGWTSPATERA